MINTHYTQQNTTEPNNTQRDNIYIYISFILNPNLTLGSLCVVW